jgi:hypothetical protein
MFPTRSSHITISEAERIGLPFYAILVKTKLRIEDDCFTETGQMEKIVLYSKKVGYTADYVGLLQHIMRTNTDKGTELATQLANNKSGP